MSTDSRQAFSCERCGFRLPAYPIYCRCGMHYAAPGVEGTIRPVRRIESACRHRGNHTGQFLKRHCRGCSPTVPVYKCALHRVCTEAASSDAGLVAHCDACDDYGVRER